MQSLWEQNLNPYEAYQRYRMGQMPGASLGEMARTGGQPYSFGFNPAYGRFLLGQTGAAYDPSVAPMGEGGAFSSYLTGGQRRPLEDIRASYSGLSNYLGSLASGADMTGISPRYASVFGLDPDRQDILSATQAALGMGPGMGRRMQQNLGSIYDIMQTQFGPQGASKFANWASSAFNPANPMAGTAVVPVDEYQSGWVPGGAD